MGIVRNEMTIVHHWDKDELEGAMDDAIKVFSEVISQDLKLTSAGTKAKKYIDWYIENMISPIMRSYINQMYTFVINGDCSQIGWELFNQFHKARMEWCEKHKHDIQSIVVINFGEGDEPCHIVFDNNEKSEDNEENAGQMDKENSYERITIIENEIKELFERIENVENLIRKDKEEELRKLKAEKEYLKFRLNLDEESNRMKMR